VLREAGAWIGAFYYHNDHSIISMPGSISRVTIVKNDKAAPRPRGRPRAFDRGEALARAMEIFWRLGYEGASIADLTAEMGITPQSLYAAFGSKAELFREALDCYGASHGSLTPELLERTDVLAVLGEWLVSEARRFADPSHPPGCMISTAMLECAKENDAVARLVGGLREEAIARLRTRLEQAKAEGELKPDSDPAALARFVGAIIQGMSVQARDGAREPELVALAQIASAELARHRSSTLFHDGIDRA
jgi:AcrR family transcriptional regulator